MSALDGPDRRHWLMVGLESLGKSVCYEARQRSNAGKLRNRDASIFHGAIADTEPDGWARRVILRDHAKRRAAARAAGQAQDHQPLTPIDFLLAVDDVNRVGALRFQDEDGVSQQTPGEGRRTAPPLIELSRLMAASRAVETNTETAEDLAYLRGRGTSLGGLRPKCSVID